MTGWKVVDIRDVPDLEGWIPLRRFFDVQAFGINGWLGRKVDDVIIGEHDELRHGHEELYVVYAGHALFTVDGKEVDGPRGTILFVRDPAARRKAVAREANTLVVAVGAKPGAVFEPSPWEWNADAFVPYRAGDYEGALKLFRDAAERYPREGDFVYNVACMEALLGRRDEALADLERSYELGARGNALEDDDFASLRDDAEFRRIASR